MSVGLTTCLKMLSENMFLKRCTEKEKILDDCPLALSLQPSNLHSNAYVTLPVNQDFLPANFMYLYLQKSEK